MHEKGTMNQMKVGSSTGMTPEVVKENVEFIDEDYSEITGVGIHTPFDVKGADSCSCTMPVRSWPGRKISRPSP